MSSADLHIHTIASDGTASVPQLLHHVAANTTLQVIAITDHDTIVGALEARRLAREFGVEVVVGEEVNTLEGHLLTLFIDKWLPPGRPAAETIAAAHAQGGLCIAAHPFDRGVPALGRAGLWERCTGLRTGHWPLDGIETFNASVAWPRRAANTLAADFAAHHGLAAIGGSDAHSLATVGLGYTCFGGTSADDLYRAIQANAVAAHGQHWRLHHYLGVGGLYVQQRGLGGPLRVLRSDGAVPLRL